jgi:hypothetical protein
MKLLTKAQAEKARKQYPAGNDMNQQIVAKLFTPWTSWTWYVMNQDPADPAYLWGIVTNHHGLEVGSFSLDELASVTGPYGLKIERDYHFTPCTAREIIERWNATQEKQAEAGRRN